MAVVLGSTVDSEMSSCKQTKSVVHGIPDAQPTAAAESTMHLMDLNAADDPSMDEMIAAVGGCRTRV